MYNKVERLKRASSRTARLVKLWSDSSQVFKVRPVAKWLEVAAAQRWWIGDTFDCGKLLWTVLGRVIIYYVYICL